MRRGEAGCRANLKSPRPKRTVERTLSPEPAEPAGLAEKRMIAVLGATSFGQAINDPLDELANAH